MSTRKMFLLLFLHKQTKEVAYCVMSFLLEYIFSLIRSFFRSFVFSLLRSFFRSFFHSFSFCVFSCRLASCAGKRHRSTLNPDAKCPYRPRWLILDSLSLLPSLSFSFDLFPLFSIDYLAIHSKMRGK